MSEKIDFWKIFENINRWLEYAERKNISLFTLLSIIPLLVILITSTANINNFLKPFLIIFLGLYIATLIITIISLFPKIKISKYILEFGNDKKIIEKDNLFFYGHIIKYSADEYRKSLVTKYSIKESEITRFEIDLIEQIIINSSITNNKLKAFQWSAGLISVGFLILIIGIILSIARSLC